MAFRFYRRVKIAPGLTLNFSKGGLSLSAGVRGARITFGKRGIRKTVGIPGSGAHFTDETSWDQLQDGTRGDSSQHGAGEVPRVAMSKEELDEDQLELLLETDEVALVNPNTNRKYSDRQLRSELKKRIKAAERERLEAGIERENKDYAGLLEHWKTLPRIPTLEEFQAYREPVSFEPLPPPESPDYESAKEKLHEQLTVGQKQGFPYSILPDFVSRRKAEESLEERWPEQANRIQQAYRKRLAEHQARRQHARHTHEQSERQRIECLEQILRDDPQASSDLAADVFENTDWPFETDAGLATHDGIHLYINLDLPEVENVIRCETPYLARGDKLGYKRKAKRDEYREYYELVLGQAVYLAANQFAWNPTLQTVSIAGFTQRVRRKAGDPPAPYIYEVTFTQPLIRSFDPACESLDALLANAGARLDCDRHGYLKPIAAPAWIEG